MEVGRLTIREPRETIPRSWLVEMSVIVRRALAVVAIALTIAGCGSPDPPNGKFVFTPVPYTVLPEVFKTPIAVAFDPGAGATGSYYLADQVLVQINRDRVVNFTSWAAMVEFDVEVRIADVTLCERDQTQCLDTAPQGISLLVVKVPVGSALDAVRLIERQHNVFSVELSYLGEGLEGGDR